MNPSKNIGLTLRLIREFYGLTQVELSLKSNVAQGWLSRVELGDVTPSIPNLIRVTLALNISLSTFFWITEHLRNGNVPEFRDARPNELFDALVARQNLMKGLKDKWNPKSI